MPNVNLDALPTIPDKVVDQIRKGVDLPIEAISPLAAEMAARRTENAQKPVYAADLTPISKAEGQARRTFGGDELPSMPVPRRVIPRPYQRPRIEVDHHGKTWQDALAETIEPGDQVVSVGRVAVVQVVPIYQPKATVLGAKLVRGRMTAPDGSVVENPAEPVAVRIELVLTNVIGDKFTVDSRAMVKVFRKAPVAAGADGP